MSLDRFKTAQASRESGISTALCELRSGAKVSHWIWYVFPQLAGLGKSEKAIFYGLADFDEARDYLRDELLRSRLVAVTAEAAARLREGVPLLTLMGSEGDCVKLSSCLTLFDLAASDLAVDPALAPELMQLRANASEVLAATAAHGVPRCAYTLAQAR